jgi:hypothetical protein
VLRALKKNDRIGFLQVCEGGQEGVSVLAQARARDQEGGTGTSRLSRAYRFTNSR